VEVVAGVGEVRGVPAAFEAVDDLDLSGGRSGSRVAPPGLLQDLPLTHYLGVAEAAGSLVGDGAHRPGLVGGPQHRSADRTVACRGGAAARVQPGGGPTHRGQFGEGRFYVDGAGPGGAVRGMSQDSRGSGAGSDGVGCRGPDGDFTHSGSPPGDGGAHPARRGVEPAGQLESLVAVDGVLEADGNSTHRRARKSRGTSRNSWRTPPMCTLLPLRAAPAARASVPGAGGAARGGRVGRRGGGWAAGCRRWARSPPASRRAGPG
jgi:hypothetical protein